MGNARLKSEYRHEKLPFSCIIVAAVFFVVLFHAPVMYTPDIVTQIFRPLIVFFLIITMTQRGKIDFSARAFAVLAALYCLFVLLLNSISVDEITSAVSAALYFLMFYAVAGTPWTKREVRFIIMACFAGAFACAFALFLSNDPTDLNVGVSGEMQMFGMHVNRNLNAYAFATGTIIGAAYLLYGKNKLWVGLLTAVIAYGLLYSQCRGAFFCAVLGVSVLVFGRLLKIRKRSEIKFLAYSVLFVLFCIAAYFILKNSELNRLIDGESKSGRDDGIKYAWQLFQNSDIFSKIFGSGFGYEAANTEGIGAHLVYLTYLLSTGIIGCAMVVLMFVSLGFRLKGSLSYAFFFCAFLRTFFEGLDYYIYIPLILSAIIYNYSIFAGREAYELFAEKQI